MLQNIKKRQEGFTIIEVMIVLVIAAVILLIVFLAVPALQRNSRNTQAKNEAAQLLAAASEWSSNNSGATPGTGDAQAIKDLTKVKNITSFKIQSLNTNDIGLGKAILYSSVKCDPTNPFGINGGGAPRQIVITYTTEGANGGTQLVCLEGGL